MRCTTVCPNDAFIVPEKSFESALLATRQDKDLIVSCERQVQIHPDECLTPCLGSLSMEFLLTLGMKRCATTGFNLMGCDGCENQPAADFFESSVLYLQDQAEVLFKTKFFIIRDPQDVPAVHADYRRSFLAGLKSRLVAAVGADFSRSSAEVEENPGQSRRVPKKVGLIRNALVQANSEQQKIISRIFIGAVVVDEKCKLCPLCKGVCPTGSIRTDRSGRGKTLIIDNSLCSRCGLCVIFCKQDALTLVQPPVSRLSVDRIEPRSENELEHCRLQHHVNGNAGPHGSLEGEKCG